jgi:hypothetical protein
VARPLPPLYLLDPRETDFICIALEHWFAAGEEMQEAIMSDPVMNVHQKAEQLVLLQDQAQWGASILTKLGKEVPPWQLIEVDFSETDD